MTKLKLLIPLALLLLLFNACGVITKARYGNGLKLNIESNLFARKDQSPPKLVVPKKKNKPKSSNKLLDSTRLLPELNDVAIAFLPDSTLGTTALNHTAQTHKQHSRSRHHVLKSAFKDGKKSIFYYTSSRSEKRKTEPTLAAGAWLFFGSIVANAFIVYSTLTFPTWVFLLLFLAFFTGMILACIGLHKIKKSQNAYKGKALAISIIVLFLLSLISFLLILSILFVVY